jgi:hypothetical protein
MVDLTRDPLLIADLEADEQGQLLPRTEEPSPFAGRLDPFKPEGTPEREALTKFYEAALPTEEEKAAEMESLLSASYAFPAGAPIDLNRLSASEYTDEELATLNRLKVTFPETTKTLGDRRAFMARNDLTYVLMGDPTQGRASVSFVPTGIQKEYEQEFFPTGDMSLFERGFEATRGFITGGGPYALQDLDEKLQRLNVGQTERTRLLRLAAEGEFTAEKISASFMEGAQFIPEAITSYAPQVTSYVLADLVAPGIEALFSKTSNQLDATPGRVATKQFFDTYSIDWKSEAERIAEKNSTPDYKLRTDVVQTMLEDAGLGERVGSFVASELPFVGAQSVLHAGRSLISSVNFASYMKKTYNKSTLAEAFEEAAARGITFEKITENYLGGVTNEKARKRLAQRLDTAFATRVALPNAERQRVFGGQLQAIRDDIKGTQYELEIATKAGDLKGVKNAQLRIADLQDKAKTIEGRILVPKYFRDLFGEVSQQTIVATYMSETAYQIFGTDSSAEPMAEFFGAVSVAVPGLRNVTMAPPRAIAGAMTWAANLVPGVDIKTAYRGASPETKAALKQVFKDPSSGLAVAFTAGANEGVRIRRELRALAEETGVDVDYDYFSKTIVDLVAVDELRAIADSLDNQISIQNLDGLNESLSRRIENNNEMKTMVTKLAESTYALINLRADGKMTSLESLDRFVGGMNDYINGLQKQIDEDTAYVNSLLKVQEDAESLLIKGGLRRANKGVSGGEESVRTLDSTYENRENAIIRRYEGDVDAGIADPEAAFENSQLELARLIDERADLLTKSANELSSAQSALGESSQHYASLLVQTKRKNVVEARGLYRALDKKYSTARSNVAEFYEKFKDITEFVDGDIDDYSRGALRLRGMDAQSITRSGAKILFNDAAQRGLDDLRSQIGDTEYASLIEHAEIGGMQPIQQWETLKKFLKDPGEKAEQVAEYLYVPGVSDPTLVNDLADASELADNLLMLISPGEWRAVDSHMGGVIAKKTREGASVTYSNLKTEWNEVSNPGSPMAFMKGYDTGVPGNVSEEFYVDFKEAKRFYERNVADRLYVDDDLRRWNTQISRRVMSKKSGDIPELEAKTKKTDQPTVWLDTVLKPVQNIKDGIPLTKDDLYQQVTQRLAKSAGGVWDEGLKKYVFVEGDKNTEAIKTILTAHMRGRLVRTKAGQNIVDRWDPTVEVKPGDKDPFFLGEPLDFNEAEFQSMLNIPVYRRDDSGRLVESGSLLNEEEIYSAIDLDALERNRVSYQFELDRAKQLYADNKQNALDSLKELNEIPENEMAFARDLARFFRITIGESGLTAQNMANVAQGVFETIANRTPERFADDLSRLKLGMRQTALRQGVDPKNVDTVVDGFIRRMTIQHIYNSSVVSAGNRYTNDATVGPAIKMALGMDGDSIRLMIGKTDLSGDTEKNLRAVLGDGVYENLETVSDTLVRLQAKAARGITGKRPGISLESLLSRIYNLNREVVSTQWVATETLIRAARSSRGALLQAIVSDERVAREIFEIIETGQVPAYKTTPYWVTSLTREIARWESVNDAIVPFVEEKAPMFGQPTETEMFPAEEGQTLPQDLSRQMSRLGYEPR